jgi:hypothetical protein
MYKFDLVIGQDDDGVLEMISGCRICTNADGERYKEITEVACCLPDELSDGIRTY